MRIALSIITLSSLLTTACVDEAPTPEAATPEEAIALLADRGELSSAAAPGLDQVTEDASKLLGRYVKALLGWNITAAEHVACVGLNMTTEQFTFGGCTYTLSNQECETSWSEAYNEYVCSCDVYLVGASGSGC